MRHLSKLMAIIFIFIISCAGAHAENKVIFIRGEGGFPGYGAIAGVAAAGDSVYACEAYEETLHVYRTGDEGAARYLFQDEYSTLALCADDEGALYRIAATPSEDGDEIVEVCLYRVTLSEDMVARTARVATLSWDQLTYYADGVAQSQEIANCLVRGGALFAVCQTEDGWRLFRFNLETGAPEDAGIEHIREVKACRDGLLLLLRFDADAGRASIDAYNPATGEIRELASMGRDAEGQRPVGLCYDEGADQIYYTYDGAVRTRGLEESGEGIRVTGMPLRPGMAGAAFLPGQYLPFNSEALATLDVTRPSADTRTLRVYSRFGAPSRNTVTRFLAQNPNVQLFYETDFLTTADLIGALMTQNQEVDAFYLDTSDTDLMTRLIDKGYAAEIDSAACAAFGNDLYPVLRDKVMRDGNLYALPIAVFSVERMGVNRQAFLDAGFKEEEIPRNWPEFIDFVAAWPAQGISDSDYLLLTPESLSGMGLRTILVARLLNDYEVYMLADGSVGYDTALFKSLLSRAMEIDFDAFPAAYAGDESYEYDSETPALFTAYYDLSVKKNDGPFRYLPLALEEGMDALVPVGCTALAINVYSPDQDIAAAFLECLMGDIEETEKAELSPYYPDTLIRADDYESTMFEYARLLDEYQALYEHAENDEERTNYGKIVEAMLEGLDELENEYLTSEESVAEYRAAMESAVFHVSRNPESGGEEATDRFITYRDRMLSGQITVDEFISFLTQMRAMQMLEEK